MRVWLADDAPLVDVYWFRTKLPFLPFPTVFSSHDWIDQPWAYDGLGEVWNKPRPYDGLESIPGLLGGHVCGTEADFLDGPAWPPVGDPLTYDADGIPTCCPRLQEPNVCSCSQPDALIQHGPAPITASGGIAWGGTATVKAYYPYTASGGIAWGGTATAHVVSGIIASGGIAWGGTAVVSTITEFISTGGIAWGGTAQVDNDYPELATGGIAWGGSCSPIVIHPYTASGGIAWGGTATVSTITEFTAEGGIAWGGTASTVIGPIETASGGIAWGGTATVVVVPSGPGPTCSTAFICALGVSYPGTIAAGTQQWWGCSSTTYLNLRCTVSGITSGLQYNQVCYGPCPATAVQAAFFNNGAGTLNLGTAPISGFLQVFGTTGTSYTVTWDEF